MTADADFGALLALRRDRRPSVLVLRSSDRLNPDQQAELVLATLARVGDELDDGAVDPLRGDSSQRPGDG